MKAFIDSTAGLIASIAALLAGLTAIITQLVKIWHKYGKDLKKTLRALLNWITALALAIVIGGFIILVARTPPQCQPTTLTITSPTAGAVVNVSEIVTGHVTCLSSDQHAWLILQPAVPGGGGYFPADEVSAAGNTWSTTVYFGQQSAVDNGRPFTLLAVIANDTADQRFRSWLAAGSATGSYPALADLTGAAVLAQIKVIRGPFQGP
jgi:hypothetical protein